MSNPVRVRFAPSPTGPLHIGGLRTALYNYLFARKTGGKFILRIEDTDEKRFVPGAKEYILKALAWANIEIDEGVSVDGGPFAPYEQSARKHIYEPYARQLVDAGRAYIAFDTEEELEAIKTHKTTSYNYLTRMSMKNSLTLPADQVKDLMDSGHPYVIRIKLPRNETFVIKDLIRGSITVNTSALDDKVLFKSNGMPTYHLANVVDDYLMKISHVIRGEEWLPSMPLHVLLYNYLDLAEHRPHFAHLPLLLNPSGKGKLSKRDGDKLNIPVFPLEWRSENGAETFAGYKEQGYLPEAVVNMLALLGWNPGTNQELFDMEELIKTFSLDRISKSGARFNIQKMKWFNQQYLKSKAEDFFLPAFKTILREHGLEEAAADEARLLKIFSLVKEKITFLKDLWANSSYFFKDPETYGEIKNISDARLQTLSLLGARLEAEKGPLEEKDLERIFKESCAAMAQEPKALMKIFRLSISGLMSGPPLFQVAELLGRKTLLKRIRTFVKAKQHEIKAAEENE